MDHPAQLGKYPITGVIGAGAMGVVYRAVDPDIGRTVAIKTLRSDARTAGAAERFLNEARAVGRLSHPGIVAIHEYGQQGDEAFIVMEHVEGRTLAQILDAIPVPGEQATLRVMDQLLAALDCAHRGGVLHRDIKPGNLIDTPQRQIKVTDFGIARIAGNAPARVPSSVGTPGYMAPEQYTGEGAGPVTDVFGAGVLLYRMLCGRAPFRGTPENIFYKLFNETPPPPSRLMPQAGRDARFDAVALTAIARDPQRRFASAAEFGAALRAAADGAAVTAPATQPTWTTDAAHAPAMQGSDAMTPERLDRLRLRVTARMGPVAAVIVKRAQANAHGWADLLRRVVDEVASGAERDAFMASLRDL